MIISVVTAVFNREKTIEQSIHSLRIQKFSSLEHVIQDGGSSDGTLDIIKRCADERTRLESGRDSGIYNAINRGIKRCTGDVVGLLHSDDELADENVLADVAAALRRNDLDGVYGDLQYVSKNDPDRVVRFWRAGEYKEEYLKRGWMPPHPTLYLRREVFDKYGLYDEGMRVSADYEAMVRWLFKDKIKLAYIPRVLVRMRVGGASNGSLKQIFRKTKEDLEVVRRYQLGGGGTIALKNLRKLNQFFIKSSNAA